MAHRYPRLFPLAALHRLNMPAGVAFIERMLRHFHAALPDDRLAAQSFRIFGYYVIGAALDETAGYAAGPSAAEPVTDEFIARECPHLAASAPYFKRPYFESTFELGFEMMLQRHRRPSCGDARERRRACRSRSCGPRRDATRVRGNVVGSLLGILVCGVIGGFAAWSAVTAWEIDGVPGALAAAAIGMFVATALWVGGSTLLRALGWLR